MFKRKIISTLLTGLLISLIGNSALANLTEEMQSYAKAEIAKLAEQERYLLAIKELSIVELLLIENIIKQGELWYKFFAEKTPQYVEDRCQEVISFVSSALNSIAIDQNTLKNLSNLSQEAQALWISDDQERAQLISLQNENKRLNDCLSNRLETMPPSPSCNLEKSKSMEDLDLAIDEALKRKKTLEDKIASLPAVLLLLEKMKPLTEKINQLADAHLKKIWKKLDS